MVREQTRRFAVACLAAAVVVLVDQATKVYVLSVLDLDRALAEVGVTWGAGLVGPTVAAERASSLCCATRAPR